MKDRLVGMMAGGDSVEIPLGEMESGPLSDLRKARIRLDLLGEGLTVDFVGTRAVAVRKAGTKASPRERWEALKAKLRADIEAIDEDTVFDGVESPGWWLEMREVSAVMKGVEEKPEPMPGRKVLATLFGDDE